MHQDINSLKQEIDLLKKENETLRARFDVVKISEIEKEKQFEKLQSEKALLQEKTKQSAITEQKLLSQIETWKDVLYKLAHSINNDLHSAGQILRDKIDDNPELIKAFYHIKRIDDLVSLNLWSLKKNVLNENWKEMDLGKELSILIDSTKRGISTLRTSVIHSQNLIVLDVAPKIIGNVIILLERDKFDSIISLIIQDLIRNAFKYSDENGPSISISLDGSSEENVSIIFTNNKLMPEEFIRYINSGDVEPTIADSSRVGLRSILEWTKYLNIDIKCWNDSEKTECSIKLIIPRSVTYENN